MASSDPSSSTSPAKFDSKSPSSRTFKSTLPTKPDNQRVSHTRIKKDKLSPRKGGGGKGGWGTHMEDILLVERSGGKASDVDDILSASTSALDARTVADIEDPSAAPPYDDDFDEDIPLDEAHVHEYVIADTSATPATEETELNDAQLQFKCNAESLLRFKESVESLAREFLASATLDTDKEAFVDAVVKLKAPQFMNQVPKVFFLIAINVGGAQLRVTEADRFEPVNQLLDTMYATKLISKVQLQSAFTRLFFRVNEMIAVNPRAYTLLTQAAEYCVDKGHLSNEFVKKLESQTEFERKVERVIELKKRVKALVLEYYSCADMEECIRCIREMETPFYTFEVVKQLVSVSLDRDNHCREMCSNILAAAVGDELPAIYDDPSTSELAPHVPKPVIDRDSAMRGFTILLHRVEDLYKDVPTVLDLLSKMLARAIHDEAIPFTYLDNVDLLDEDMGSAVIWMVREMLAAKSVASRMINVWGLSCERPIEELKLCVAELIKEYLNEMDMNETVTVIKDMTLPSFGHEIVKQLVVAVADYMPPLGDGPVREELRKEKAEWAVDLLKGLLENNVIPFSQIEKGLEVVRSRLSDYRLDVPNIEEHLENIASHFTKDPTQAGTLTEASITCASGVVTEADFVEEFKTILE